MLGHSRVFTIPASAPFIETLVAALTAGELVPGIGGASCSSGRRGGSAAGEALQLAATTLYLPTRRACALARNSFLDITGKSAAILPRVVAIGDIDEDDIAFAHAATGGVRPVTVQVGSCWQFVVPRSFRSTAPRVSPMRLLAPCACTAAARSNVTSAVK